jgi:hypothetical protein
VQQERNIYGVAANAQIFLLAMGCTNVMRARRHFRVCETVALWLFSLTCASHENMFRTCQR